MFYDDAFARITASSAFSEKAVLTIGASEYNLNGFFYSGNYGEKKMDKGYSVAKTVKRQSFETAKANLPAGVEVTDLARKSLLVRFQTRMEREGWGRRTCIVASIHI